MSTFTRNHLKIVSNQHVDYNRALSRRADVKPPQNSLAGKVHKTFAYIGDGFSDPTSVIFTSAKAVYDVPAFGKKILATLQDEVPENFYTPTAGESELLDTLSDQGARLGLAYTDKDNIVVTAGAVNAFYSLCHSLCDSGDVILALSPSYILFANAVNSFGGELVLVPSHLDGKFRITPEALEQKIEEVTAQGRKIKAVLAVNPTNIDGQCWTKEDIDALAPILKAHKLLLIEDRVYDGLQYDRPVDAGFFGAHPQLKNQTVTIDSVSKRYGATQWRIGWLYAPKEIASAARSAVMQTVWSPNSKFQKATARMIRAGLDENKNTSAHQSYFSTLHDQYKIRRDLCIYLIYGASNYASLPFKDMTPAHEIRARFADILSRYEHLEEGVCGFTAPILPQAGMFLLVQAESNLFSRFETCNNPDLVFARLLYKVGGVMMLPPTELTLPETARMFRMEFGTSLEDLVEGLSRMSRFAKLLNELSDEDLKELIHAHTSHIPEAHIQLVSDRITL